MADKVLRTFSCKNLPQEVIDQLNAARARNGSTMAEEIERGARLITELDRGERILPPPVEPDNSRSNRDLARDADSLARMLEAVTRAAEVNGASVPKRLMGQANAFAFELLREARGLPVRGTTPGITGPDFGSTAPRDQRVTIGRTGGVSSE